MKKLSLFIVVSLSVISFGYAQSYSPSVENIQQRSHFQDMKFGMFIHWGASSVLGNGEWVMNNRNIRVDEYSRLLHIFNPVDFDAKKWVEAAKNAGMKYITFITRHHDGFSNWDTKQSDWKITNTPYGKDVVKQIADECHKQGIQLFFYYSLLDWYRSDYQFETGRTGKGTGRVMKSDWAHYISFMKAQLTELLTNYGTISGIWFDGHWDQLENDTDKNSVSKVDWHYNEIYQLIHQLQPQCMIGNNHHLLPISGEDFQMFEKDLPGANTTGFGGASVSKLPLETCETMNDSWGFNITDRNYKSVKQLIQYLVTAAGNNANFLLNIGPMPNGIVQQEFTDTLQAIGKWMNKNGESIYGTRGNIIPTQEWGVITAASKKLYVHILKNSNTPYIFIPGLKQQVNSATDFAEKKSIRFKQQSEGLFIYLDQIKYDEIDTIIQLQIQ
jgi:alpha-L-fucosidase